MFTVPRCGAAEYRDRHWRVRRIDVSITRSHPRAPGKPFDPRGEDRANVRLSISRVDQRDIERGIALLAEAVHAVQGGVVHSAPVV